MKLLQYIKGLRKGKDAHRIEQDAMTDTFLADALEGFDAVDANHAERIERMQRRVAQLSQKNDTHAAVKVAAKRAILLQEAIQEEALCAEMSFDEAKEAVHLEPQAKEKKKRRSLVAWMAAAVMLLFVATGSYIWLQKENSATPQLAATAEYKHDTNKDAAPATQDEEMPNVSSTDELIESDAKVIAQNSGERNTRQEQAAPILSPVIPSPPATPLIDDTEEAQILAEVEESILVENIDRYLGINAGFDSISSFALSDTGTSNLLALKKEADKIEPSGSIIVINADELGSQFNTNRRALSQSQKQSQGKVGGRLAEQRKPTTSKREQRREAASAMADLHDAPSLSASENVRGRVVDENGEPIPFVTVQVKGTNTATTTDMEGYFALNAKNAETLVANFIGFDQVELPVDTIKPMTIAMNESTAQLEDMVVVAYGVSRADDYSPSAGIIVPEPEMGYSAYNKYLRNSLIKPTDECAEVEGRVVLNFYVNSSGRPYNIEVRRSLCPSADEEAIRLVREGGSWTLGTGRVRLSVKF